MRGHSRFGTMLLCAAVANMVAAGVLARDGANPVSLSLRLTGEYTDNRDSVAEKESNVDLYVVPRIDAWVSSQRTWFNFFYAPGYRYRTDPSPIQNESELHHDLGLNVDFDVSPRFDLRVRERFTLTDDPSIDEGGETVRRDSSYLMNRSELGGRWAVGRQGEVDVFGRHRIKRYDDDDVADVADEEQWTAQVEYWRQISQTLSLSLAAMYEIFDQQDRPDMERGFDSYQATIGAEKTMGPMMRGMLRVGYKELDYDDSELSRQGEPSVDAVLRFMPLRSLHWIARGGYMLRDAEVFPYVSQKRTLGSLSVEWEASPRWMLKAGGEYRLSEYDVDALPTGARDLQEDVFLDGGDEESFIFWAAAELSLDHRATLRFRQQYEDVDSDVWASYTRNTTRLELVKRF